MLTLGGKFLTAVALLAVVCAAPARAAEPKQADLDFFEKRIRPVLVEHCFECHHPGKKVKGGLRLDSRDGWSTGGDSGPAIEPGKPDDSLLLELIRYESTPKMPPKGKLPDEVIADFEKWIKSGAADPRTAKAAQKTAAIDIEAGRKHWAYQLPKVHPSPVVKDAAWPKSEIDRFILAALEAKGLPPSPEADRATLCRRLHYDLIGLPPTPEEIDVFVKDESPDAYEKLVDRLLASPHFGERWGRHWLDVARFAESMTLRGFIFKEAWRYRDYVIDTFSQDRPFNRFIVEQIAGDLLPGDSLEDKRRHLIATTFLVLGNTNLEEQDKVQLRMDVVDEQLEAIGKGFLAQTIGCARCHDHKFDPIPTKDYYALAGIFRNTKTLEHSNVSNWLELPLPVPEEQEVVFKQHEKKLAALTDRIKQEKELLAKLTKATTPAGPAIIAAKDLPGIVVDDSQAKKVGEWKDSKFSGRYIGDGYTHDLDKAKGEKTLTFLPELPQAGKYEVRLAYTPGDNRASKVPVTVFSADGEKTIHVDEKVAPPIDGRFISLGQYRFELNGQGFVIVSNEDTTGHVIADAVQFIPAEQIQDQPAAKDAQSKDKETKKEAPADEKTRGMDELKRLEAELKNLTESGPKRPLTMSVREESEIADTQVHVRGSVHNLGPAAPRGFLQVATYGSPIALPEKQSGRRELGEWIARSDNPLTARVIVNRVWHWLFGTGLVRTTDNFGTTGELPSHPELLDTLAVHFMDEGWKLKPLIRQIVLSRTYRQSSTLQPKAAAVDPENRLFGRMNRRRMEAEALRDTLLSVSGRLDLTAGDSEIRKGTTADYGYVHDSLRRSVYLPVFRNALPELFDVFDFADPSTTTGRRNVSTVAPQALFFMNNSFVLDQARSSAKRVLAETHPDDVARLTRAYRFSLGRSPSVRESEIAFEFLKTSNRNEPTANESAWTQLFQALFASLDFRYVD